MSQENVELLRPAYAALNRGDVDAVLQVCAPGIECQLPEGGLNAGALRGHQAVRGFLEGYIESFESFRMEPEEFIDAGDRVLVFLRMLGRGRGSGIDVEVRPAHVWTVQGGKAVRLEAFPERSEGAAFQAAGLSREGVETSRKPPQR
jgi:ketosteroid isomerase-like protein